MQVADKISTKPFPGLRSKTFPVLILFFFANIQESFPQVFDDFSDGDFLSEPSWRGSTDHFIVNASGELQLNAAAAGRSWLITDYSAEPSQVLEWQVSIRQTFAPSGSNYGRFYLLSDQPDLSGPLKGYYLQFGEAGADDAVELFHQSGTSRTSLCRGRAGAIANAFAIRVKVQRHPDGTWYLLADYSGGTDYVAESTGYADAELSGAYVGVLCNYTVSNVKGFYFDDIRIEGINLPDTISPSVVMVEPLDSRTLKVVFSESLDRPSVRTESFTVLPDNEPIAVTLQEDGRTAILSFGFSFLNGVESTLHVRDVRDPQENVMDATNVPFRFFEELPVGYRDIVISEILADPSPPRGLPEAEFLELYNRSQIAVDLAGWILADNTSAVALPSLILVPGKYVILTAGHSSEDFRKYGETLAVKAFPSLNNTGDRLILNDDGNNVIDSVSYERDWYRDDEKADGGWSLERIDPDDACSGGANWVASEAAEGGTPGTQNSVHASRPDRIGPGITWVAALDSLTLLISFNERLDRILPATDQFLLEDGPQVKSVRFADATLTNFLITLAEPIQRGRKYTITITNVYDCPGNRILPGHAQAWFLLPEVADPGDIVVNEVLFNPRPTGVDFVEIYNASHKVVDLEDWTLRSARGTSSVAARTSETSLLLFPGQYLVFTPDPHALKGEYIMGLEETFVEMKLPPLNDDEGFVSLLDERGQMIDSIHYSDEMHSAFLKDDEGVSLERISASIARYDVANWRSASSVTGFATPGYLNSNARADFPVGDGAVIIAPEIIRQQISQHDFARIQYQFARGGLIATVRIYDHQGRAIRTIAENELLGTEGFFRWDGDTDGRGLAATGYYMVLFEVFGLDGFRQAFRHRVAVY